MESLEKNEPYLVVQGSGGVMVQGTVSEINLDKLTVGATVTVNSWDTGEMLTAEVTEIDKTPTSYTNQNGSENPNNSAYPFKAAVTDSNSLSVGSYVSLSFSGAADDVGDTFYLPVSYVRQENGSTMCCGNPRTRSWNGRMSRPARSSTAAMPLRFSPVSVRKIISVSPMASMP